MTHTKCKKVVIQTLIFLSNFVCYSKNLKKADKSTLRIILISNIRHLHNCMGEKYHTNQSTL